MAISVMSKNYCQTLAILMLAGILISGNHQVMARKCRPIHNKQLAQLVFQCKQYVNKGKPNGVIKPSTACCKAVNTVGLCLCQLVTKKLESQIDMQKVIKVARKCTGQRIPPGTKCGSYTVPRA
ncbi:hypothetical protein I3760_13G153200 [Carya illinoinensis]|nr:hypothetical protein I3760_13G153200 [Carya illinoinensis]